jgi:heat shock protein HtpX
MNAIKTTLLLGVLSGILLFAGELIGGRNGVYTALVIAIGVNFFSYFFSDRMALSMYSAQPLTQTEHPEICNRLYPIVWGLSQKMGIPCRNCGCYPTSPPTLLPPAAIPSTPRWR